MAYIYLHRRNDTGEVFYVGKGTGKRATETHSRNSHWHNVVNKAGFTAEIIAKGKAKGLSEKDLINAGVLK